MHDHSNSPLHPTASSFPAAKKTRHEIATHTALSLRYIDELTHNGTLPYFKIGKSIRYDLTEVEAALRERFHVQPKARKPRSTGTRAPSSAA
jgi:excisionase family DNA binding protein